MYTFIFIFAALIIILKVYQKLTLGRCTCTESMIGKVVLITGANAGIGFQTAKELAKRGAKVILACRNKEKGERARNIIIEETNNRNVVLQHLDLTSLTSVDNLAKLILTNEPKIDVLINNAGTGKLDNSLTEDGLPIEMQVNHFGPFLLTVLLLPLLKSSAPSRIINVSSVMHKFGKINLDRIDKQAKSTFAHIRVYSDSKLANILFTNKLSRDLEGSGVTVNSLHPGAVSTEMFRHQNWFTKFLISILFKTPLEGAQTTIHLAVAPELDKVSGKYFVDCKESSTSLIAKDNELADKLYELSEKIVISKIKMT